MPGATLRKAYGLMQANNHTCVWMIADRSTTWYNLADLPREPEELKMKLEFQQQQGNARKTLAIFIIYM